MFSSTTTNRVQKLKNPFLSPKDEEECSLLKNLFEFVSHGTHMIIHVVEGQLLKKANKTDL